MLFNAKLLGFAWLAYFAFDIAAEILHERSYWTDTAVLIQHAASVTKAPAQAAGCVEATWPATAAHTSAGPMQA